ncbi:MAG: undecaprenyldiphospho-muramoylpentapeptide beta-N-acetylglucosaminyltransferase [Firmicutes bacterium]|nr:undecaprenyldiphospho-muramoylpentapeptide beta-N-acetylglucosaminyltransferase [Bacillota bacterium]
MKFLITGGGTGGHITPALAIAREIKNNIKDADILYVGTEKGLESELVPREGFKFESIRVKGFRRKISLDTLKSLKELLLGLNDARKIVKKFKPDIVIGTGGYVCGPVVLVASLKNIPTMIHEQNALPGVTNRILSKFVDKIAASFEDSKKYFKDKNKVVVTGNPIREEFIKINKDNAYKKTSKDKKEDFILVLGGSGGQKSLNNAMLDVIDRNLYNSNMKILHVTGKKHYNDFINKLKEKGISKLNDNIEVVPYFYEMASGLKNADIVITSAGAITLAEVTAVGVPTILVPKSYTAENHQEHNARALEKKGASKVILEKDLNGKTLDNNIKELLKNKSKLKEMSKASNKLARIDSTERIFDIIKKLINNNN